MIVRYAPWHTLDPCAIIVRDGPAGGAPVTLIDVAHILRPGETVTVLEPEEPDALAILSAHFDVSIVEE